MKLYFEELPTAIRELYMHDATVRDCLNVAFRNSLSYTEILEKMVVHLAGEKKAYFDKAIELSQNTISPHVFMPLSELTK